MERVLKWTNNESADILDKFCPENVDVYTWVIATNLHNKIMFPDNPDSLKRGIEHAPLYTFEEFISTKKAAKFNYTTKKFVFHYPKQSKLDYWRDKIEPNGVYLGLKGNKEYLSALEKSVKESAGFKNI